MLARFTSTAPEFYIFREFRYLQSRALLHLQDELRALETQLYRMDERDRTEEPRLLHCREYDDMYKGQRKVMMELINQKLVQYGPFPTSLFLLSSGSTLTVWFLQASLWTYRRN